VRRLVLALAVGLLGCPDEGGLHLTDGMPPPPPASDVTTDVATTGTSTTTTGGQMACCDESGCTACDGGLFCVADRDLAAGKPEPSAFTCREACVPTNLVGLWCTSTATCCSAEATCDPETGLCKGPLPSTTTGTGTGTDTDTGTDTTGSDTGSTTSSDSTSTGMGTDTTSGTGTTAAT
jgi:hypothetical protein